MKDRFAEAMRPWNTPDQIAVAQAGKQSSTVQDKGIN